MSELVAPPRPLTVLALSPLPLGWGPLELVAGLFLDVNDACKVACLEYGVALNSAASSIQLLHHSWSFLEDYRLQIIEGGGPCHQMAKVLLNLGRKPVVDPLQSKENNGVLKGRRLFFVGRHLRP